MEHDLGIPAALQHFPVHLAVTHSAAALAALGVYHDLAGELARSGVKIQTTLLQAEVSANRVKRIAKREGDRAALRIHLKCNTWIGRGDGSNRDKGDCNQERPTHSTPAGSLGIFRHRIMQSTVPTPA